MRFSVIYSNIFFLGILFGLMVTPVKAGTTQTDTSHIQLAITLDDLPWLGSPRHGESATQAVERIAAVLRVHKAPATGFVVSENARRNEQPLRAWVAWGNTLGNHSATHPDLNNTPVDEWLADVAHSHDYLKKFDDAYLPYFRYPLLHQGNTSEKQSRVYSALREMGLRTAHVTVDNSEWILADAYTFALENENAPLRHEIGQEFIRHILDAVKHADEIARHKTGRSVPQILLLHANTLMEDKLDALLLELRANGVEFISLEQALEDPVYSRTDEYIGPKGVSWLYRMQPLSIEDVQWDDAEAASIRERFSKTLPGNRVDIPRDKISMQHVSTDAPAGLDSLLVEAGESERMRSLLLMHREELVTEAYFNGVGPETPINLKSVTKSLASALVGIAIHKGWIGSAEDSIQQYLPELLTEYPDKADITIRQLLTMSSGLRPVDYGYIQHQSDWVETVLSQPLNPGTRDTFVYDTPAMQLLAAVLRNTSGMPVSQMAQQELLDPLGGELIYWRTDAQGVELGGNDAYLLPRDLIKIGELYRQGGAFNEHVILPEEYIAASISRQIMPESGTINHGTLPVRGYGYLWWLLDWNHENVYAALGHGGQILLVSPERELVVLMTSRWPSTSSTAHYQHLTRILVEGVLPLFPID